MMIEIQGLTKRFGQLVVFENFNLSIRKGETVALVGPSGCGKTTLLNCVTGLDKNYDGQILINGLNSKEYLQEKRISIVLQRYSNFEWQTINENIRSAFVNRNITSEEQEKTINNLIERTGLLGFENSYINELSGGMQQRVAVARALAQSNEILAFDEPFGSLDIENRSSLQILFREQITKKNLTAIFITHDIEEAILVSERIAILKKIPSLVTKIIETNNITDKYSQEFNSLKEEVEKTLKL
ncbi:ABC transporter ATP-binding protein [Flagellimonas myxillae]|uniref:ABC transporter ATP-binding protein n=1 Tax=Flagellimonas myxillae TaxID=2942214 RepID=UPI00201F2427|nr:ABC transporter ATP-binding protein [Muricauda myxillae]MCL6268155.1 ABC transporter ATP-binding protein [Muricauda myxillae]